MSGGNTQFWSSGKGDVPYSIVAPPARFMPLVDAVSDSGAPLTATATGGAMGFSRAAGSGFILSGEATSASAKTDKCVFDFALPDTYVAGNPVTVTVNASITGSGTLTASSCTMTLNAFTENTGAEVAIPGVTAAQQIVAAGSNLVFTIPGAGLVAGMRLLLELVMLVTSSSGANTGQVNSLSYVA